ncbi:hypothetical protein A3N42_19285 [Klebsiella aerogenes]|uniref:DUF1120 domain-containing protein n=1 Tax=Klebsiella aerogenes TaxID=548 RepID=UPI0007B39256|nr:DUF1120 domain-containing protein [Klebsiella aerogenes]KZQ00373.1 hypothetical protein A3N42_19285 [Klebsiella aerogenes]
MNKLTKISAATLMFFTVAGQAMAADDNVDVKVTGQIVPPACVPAVNGGAVFDYGAIKAGSLPQDDFFTGLTEKSLKFAITCDSPMKIAFTSVDGRKGSAVIPVGKSIQQQTITEHSGLMGVGLDGNMKIGAYSLNVANMKIDSGDGVILDYTKYDSISSSDNGKTWRKVNRMYLNDNNEVTSVAAKGTLTPLTVKTLTGDIFSQLVINKGSELDLTKVIHIDGMSSVQVIYL